MERKTRSRASKRLRLVSATETPREIEQTTDVESEDVGTQTQIDRPEGESEIQNQSDMAEAQRESQTQSDGDEGENAEIQTQSDMAEAQREIRNQSDGGEGEREIQTQIDRAESERESQSEYESASQPESDSDDGAEIPVTVADMEALVAGHYDEQTDDEEELGRNPNRDPDVNFGIKEVLKVQNCKRKWIEVLGDAYPPQKVDYRADRALIEEAVEAGFTINVVGNDYKKPANIFRRACILYVACSIASMRSINHPNLAMIFRASMQHGCTERDDPENPENSTINVVTELVPTLVINLRRDSRRPADVVSSEKRVSLVE